MTVVNRAFSGLRAMIGAGRWVPGDRLPIEAELAAELDVSRSSLREALRMLAVMGVLESRRGSGWTVSKLGPREIVTSFRMAVELLPLEALLPLLEVRRMLETQVVMLAAAHATEEDIARLECLSERMVDCDDPAELVRLDHAFHELLIGCGRNEAASALLDVFRARSSQFHLFALPEGMARRNLAFEQHREMVRALRARDAAWLSVLTYDHIKRTERWLAEARPVVSPN